MQQNTGSKGRLDGHVVLVTGAGRGIGEACARAAAHEGALVVVTDIDESSARRVAEDIGGAARFWRLDVRDEHAWDEVVGRVVETHGRLDGLVNNAGITGLGVNPDGADLGSQDPEHATLSGWRAVHATNLDGVFLGCRSAIRAMRPPGVGGSIVNMSSRSGVVGVGGAAAYASSKAAIRNHTKSVALYCAERGYAVRCNSVHPGAVMTPMWDDMLGAAADRAAAIEEIASGVPLGRMGQPGDVTGIVVHLLSAESAYTTGGEFAVDGGLTAGTSARPRG